MTREQALEAALLEMLELDITEADDGMDRVWASQERARAALELPSAPALTAEERHSCEAWAQEGIGCRHCNPISQAVQDAAKSIAIAEVLPGFTFDECMVLAAAAEDVNITYQRSARKSKTGEGRRVFLAAATRLQKLATRLRAHAAAMKEGNRG